jgi:hypothetical protein
VVGILTETDVMAGLRSDEKVEAEAEYFAW